MKPFVSSLVSWVCLTAVIALAGHCFAASPVVINEIMYHPASENPLEEYVELLNPGSTNVNLANWRFSRGVQFAFTNFNLAPGSYLVVAADLTTFKVRYPGVSNVVGGWTGRLSNARNTLDLDDPASNRVDSVTYADEGDWAIRQRGPLDIGHQGWIWLAEHDGRGKSLELINPLLPNQHGQNWAASLVTNGTPGRANSVLRTNVAPLILDLQHLPPVPRSLDPVLVIARLLDEHASNVTAALNWRVDGTPDFSTVPMLDDGQHDDGAPGDGTFAAIIPPQTNNAVVEFFVSASDQGGLTRTWPAAVVDTNGATMGQAANALYQVDDSSYAGSAPLYKLIMTEAERAELWWIGSSSWPGESQSDAQMNGTFLSRDGEGTQVRYVVGIRNRGHGTRNHKPNNYRLSFPSDHDWKGDTGLNINGQYTHAQLLGSVLSLKSGLIGASSRAVQVRVNNVNLANNGPQTYGGMYVANEVINSDWAEHWFPDDASGNVYRAVRDIRPPGFTYRGTDSIAYRNTYFKETNVSEDNWSDLIALLEVMGENQTNLFTTTRARGVVNVEQWMLHLAVMNLFGNYESGLNTGYNDDYYLYRGVQDPRFLLMYHDLDQVLGEGISLPTNYSIFFATLDPLSGETEGTWRAINHFMHWPEFEPIYFRTLDRLLNTTFSETQFNATADQTLGDFVPAEVLNNMKTWMGGRRADVRTQIASFIATNSIAPMATISGEPRSPTPLRSATLNVGGAGVVQYRYNLNGGSFSAPTAIGSPIILTNLAQGSTNTVSVLGLSAGGVWQSAPTASRAWIVNTNWPAVRINEVLAANVSAFSQAGTFPDAIELLNEGTVTVDLSGLRLTDRATSPNKFTFPAGTTLAAGARLVVIAGDSDGTSGFHTGFSLDQDGEGVFLFDRIARTGALLDSVEFGLQLPDFSIGRLSGGGFVLMQPSLGNNNVAYPLGDPLKLRINEWLASEFVTSATDFVELYNPEALPVALGGLRITDNPIGEPMKHVIAPLSFIAAKGIRVFKADGDTGQGLDHLGFKLASEQGMITLLTPALEAIDSILYGAQRTDISQGRVPDGSEAIADFSQPSPGAPNSVSLVGQTLALNEILANNQSLTNVAGRTPDWVELFNVSASVVDLSGLSLSDDSTQPRKWVFPPGSAIAPGGYLVIECDDGVLTSATNTGFALSSSSGAVFLFKRPADGGTVQDSVIFGVQAEDFSIGRVPSGNGAWTLGLPTRGTANVAAGLGNASFLKLNEWMANPASGDDWIELYNPSPQPVDLSGLALTDDAADRNKSPFLPLSFIGPGRFLKLIADDHTGAGADHLAFQLDAGGDFIGLYWPIGTQIGSVSFGPQGQGISQGRFPDGATAVVNFTNSVSPGAPNYFLLPGLFINELLSHTDPPLEDAVEIYNAGSSDVNIGGWYLSNSGQEPRKFLVPANTLVPAKGYRVFYEYQFGTNTSPAALVPFNFNSAHGDEVHLSQTDANGNLTGYRARAVFGAAINGVSFGRFSTTVGEEFVAMSRRSFGADDAQSLGEFRTGTGATNPAPLIGPVVISEIHFNPTNLYGADNNAGEYLELWNITTNAVPLFDPGALTNTWRIRGGVEFTFPPNVTLSAGGLLLLVSFDPVNDPLALAWFRGTYQVSSNTQVLGPFAGALANEGEAIELFRPDPPQAPPHPDAGFVPHVLVERVAYLPNDPWPTNSATGTSLQRSAPAGFGNEPVSWFAAPPSAGVNNYADTDGDGLPDFWERANGLSANDPNSANGAGGDPDGDGQTNAQEFVAGTRPKDGADLLRIESARPVPDGLEIRFRAAAGRTYSLLYSDGSPAGPWHKLLDPAGRANATQMIVLDHGPAAGQTRFYRLVTPVQP